MPQLFRRSAAVLVVLFMVLSASQASAALIAQISWQVTGGTFDFDGIMSPAKGAITGGSLLFMAPAGGIESTSASGYGGSWNVILSGLSGFFEMSLAPGSGFISITTTGFYGAFRGVPVAASGPNPTALVANQILSPTGGFYGYLTYNLSATGYRQGYVVGYTGNDGMLFTHSFTLGNEIRTVVPEPATATLLGLGLLVLGVVAAGGGTSAQLRRRGPA